MRFDEERQCVRVLLVVARVEAVPFLEVRQCLHTTTDSSHTHIHRRAAHPKRRLRLVSLLRSADLEPVDRLLTGTLRQVEAVRRLGVESATHRLLHDDVGGEVQVVGLDRPRGHAGAAALRGRRQTVRGVGMDVQEGGGGGDHGYESRAHLMPTLRRHEQTQTVHGRRAGGAGDVLRRALRRGRRDVAEQKSITHSAPRTRQWNRHGETVVAVVELLAARGDRDEVVVRPLVVVETRLNADAVRRDGERSSAGRTILPTGEYRSAPFRS